MRLTIQQWWKRVQELRNDPYPPPPYPRLDSALYSLFLLDMENEVERPDGYRPSRWRVAIQLVKEAYWDLLQIWPLYALRSLVCVIRGHRVRCESDAGPESGSETLYCSRCGWSSTHIYY